MLEALVLACVINLGGSGERSRTYAEGVAADQINQLREAQTDCQAKLSRCYLATLKTTQTPEKALLYCLSSRRGL